MTPEQREELRRLHAGKWHPCPRCEEYTCDPCDMAPLLDALDAREREVERLREALEEFVSVADAFPEQPLGPNTKKLFADGFRRALEASEEEGRGDG